MIVVDDASGDAERRRVCRRRTARSCCAATRTAAPAPHATPGSSRSPATTSRSSTATAHRRARLAAPLLAPLRRPAVAAVAPRIVGAADDRGRAGTGADARQPRPRRPAGAGHAGGRGSPTCRARRWSRGAVRSTSLGGAVFDGPCASARMSTSSGASQRRVGGSATTRPHRSRTPIPHWPQSALTPVPLRHVRRPTRRAPPGRDRSTGTASVADTHRRSPCWPAGPAGRRCRFAASLASTARKLQAADVPTAGLLPPMVNAAPRPGWDWVAISTHCRSRCCVAALRMRRGALAAARSRSVHRCRMVAAMGCRLRPGHARLFADQVAYGTGVWTGSVRARTLRALRPVAVWRPLRVDARRS